MDDAKVFWRIQELSGIHPRHLQVRNGSFPWQRRSFPIKRVHGWRPWTLDDSLAVTVRKLDMEFFSVKGSSWHIITCSKSSWWMSGHLRQIGRSQSSQLQCKYWSASNLRCSRSWTARRLRLWRPSWWYVQCASAIKKSDGRKYCCETDVKSGRAHTITENGLSRLSRKTLMNVEMNRWIVWTWADETHLTSRKDPRRKQHVTVGLISSCNSFHWQRDTWSRFRNYSSDDSKS